ncbi:MAG: cytochrome c biogenesis protein CcsA [Armatimonadetes bacterium]|nr:cytochrome c biogenesis protein CcsA [Armatimonadota bacterium]
MIWRGLLFLAATGTCIAYVLAPAAQGFAVGESARIIFFHVPPAMLCTLFFLWAAVMGIRYLLTRNTSFDHRCLAAVEIGFLLCFLATVTGMIFARQQWGAYWQWDARQTSILIQLLIYAAYFALRFAFVSAERAAANSAAYATFAFLTVPFLIWILPRLPQIQKFSLHGGANEAVIGGGLDASYRMVLYPTLIVILFVAAWAYRLRVREAELTHTLEEMDALASSGGDTADSRVVRPVRIHDAD